MYVTEGRRSSLGLMQSLPHPEVCRVKIYALWLMIFYSHSFQPASLPANPPTPGLLGFMCRQTKTLTRTETCAVIWSHLMVKEGNGSNIFTRKIGSQCMLCTKASSLSFTDSSIVLKSSKECVAKHTCLTTHSRVLLKVGKAEDMHMLL